MITRLKADNKRERQRPTQRRAWLLRKRKITTRPKQRQKRITLRITRVVVYMIVIKVKKKKCDDNSIVIIIMLVTKKEKEKDYNDDNNNDD